MSDPDDRLQAGYTAARIRSAEEPLLAAGEPLMQRAAAGLAAEALRELGGSATGRGVLVLAGSGNNGGDAMFAAATLAASGARVTIVACGSRLHDDALAAARDAGADLVRDASPEEVGRRAGGSDLVLDGILGTGSAASPALREPARSIVAALAVGLDRTTMRVIAVDLPSGVGADDGSVHEPVLAADVTVTFGAMKAGLLRDPARSVAGEVRLVDIGLGPHL